MFPFKNESGVSSSLDAPIAKNVPSESNALWLASVIVKLPRGEILTAEPSTYTAYDVLAPEFFVTVPTTWCHVSLDTGVPPPAWIATSPLV